ncbi:MAG: hypothetical protein U0797_20240 [Gemmataceae bacterium]
MATRILIPLAALALALAQGGGKGPESQYGLDLRARKASEPEFTKDTRKFGVEVYADGATGDGLFVSEVGTLAAVPAKLFRPDDGKSKEPLWQHGLSLTVRPAGEKAWERGQKVSLEVFQDQTGGGLLYVSERGALGAVPAKYASATAKGKPKNPKWTHAMELKVRRAGDKGWDKAKRFSVEVFRDENNGTVIYVTEGGFAVVPAKLAAKDDTGKDPAFQHGLELAARKQGEREFTRGTKRYGVEVFLDGNTGHLVYLCETGALAVVPGKFARATEAGVSKAPDLRRAMDLRVRKAGQREFGKDCPRFGVEVYSDESNGNVIYLSETGELAAVPPKAE